MIIPNVSGDTLIRDNGFVASSTITPTGKRNINLKTISDAKMTTSLGLIITVLGIILIGGIILDKKI